MILAAGVLSNFSPVSGLWQFRPFGSAGPQPQSEGELTFEEMLKHVRMAAQQAQVISVWLCSDMTASALAPHCDLCP